jgi:hypothetical protein
VYVADANDNRIARFTADGTFLSMWGSSGTGPGQFAFPTGLGVDPAGHVFVGDHNNDRVDVFDSTGTLLYSWGGAGSAPDRFYGPNGIALFGPDVYVADYGNVRIQRFSFAVPRVPDTSPTHYLVDPAGHGDYTAIQPALDAIVGSTKDTILVASGSYAENLVVPSTARDLYLVGAGGASTTTVHGAKAPADSPTRWHVLGLTVASDGDMTGFDFRSCAFGGVLFSRLSLQDGCSAFTDCDFYGRTRMYGGGPGATITSCRFHSAPFQLNPSGLGGVSATGCTFEGPADTLLTAGGDDYDRVGIYGCTFRNATNGALFGGGGGFEACLFQNITGNAIWSEDPCQHSNGTTELDVGGCRFGRCGSAIRWLNACEPLAVIGADTVLACTGDAITVSESAMLASHDDVIHDVVVDGGGGHGITVVLANSFKCVGLANCRVQNVTGDAFRIVDAANVPEHFQLSRLRGNRADHAGGAGFRVTSSDMALAGNLAWANGGDGIAFTTHHQLSAQADSVISNTCVANGGDGIRMQYADGLTGVDQVVQRNVVAANSGAGLEAMSPFRGDAAFNDAFANSGGDYVGVASPADSNLALDPVFCAASLGDFGLQASSPCAPSGPYGSIGARPVGCLANAGVTPDPAALRFTVYPNPARGGLALAAPASTPGRVEIIDLAGRRLWERSLRAGERVRWDGRGDQRPDRARRLPRALHGR